MMIQRGNMNFDELYASLLSILKELNDNVEPMQLLMAASAPDTEHHVRYSQSFILTKKDNLKVTVNLDESSGTITLDFLYSNNTKNVLQLDSNISIQDLTLCITEGCNVPCRAYTRLRP